MAKKSTKALLVIDMLNDFVLPGAPLEVPETRKVVKNIQREIKKAREEKVPVIYLCDSHRKGDPELKVYPPHALKGSKGSKVIEELKPQAEDVVIEKHTFSGFFNTDLDYVLAKLKVKELLVTGCVTNICVAATVADAFYRGYKTKVIKDCVAGLDTESHNFGLKQMASVFGAEIV